MRGGRGFKRGGVRGWGRVPAVLGRVDEYEITVLLVLVGLGHGGGGGEGGGGAEANLTLKTI